GIYLLPNLITIGSLLSGVMGIHWTIQGHFDLAAWAIVLSAILDSLDGTVARVTRTQSLFGQELDSLSDMIAFGATPGILMFMWALQPFGKYGFGALFLYVACTALRLARFNVQSGTVERRAFQGLPSPGAAIMIASTILLYYDMGGEGNPSRHWILLAESYVVALLMVSNIAYLSSKSLHLESVKAFQTLFLVVLALSLVVAEPTKGLFVVSFLYVASGPVLQLRRLIARGEPVTH
ncbi:MAG: CDP-diacylglycerol--serine O-phosphatidyltransferase, partial [Candidatus Dadabacteria bacterium]